MKSEMLTEQWRSQDVIANARAQHGHTTFKRISAPSAEVLGRSSIDNTPYPNASPEYYSLQERF